METSKIVKEVIYLLWEGAGSASNMGFLQDRGPGVTRDQVWDQAFGREDYNFSGKRKESQPVPEKGEVYMDYVFGRCLKTRVKWEGAQVTIFPELPKATWQDWCRTYKSSANVLAAATKNLNMEVSK